MTAAEVNKLLALAKANYSYAFKTMSNQEKVLLVQSWTFALQDIPTDVVMMAFMQLLSKCKWLPTVAEIRQQAAKLHREAERILYDIRNAEEVDKMMGGGKSTTPELAAKRAAAKSILSKTWNLADDEDSGLTLQNVLDSAIQRGNLTSGGDVLQGLIPDGGENE